MTARERGPHPLAKRAHDCGLAPYEGIVVRGKMVIVVLAVGVIVAPRLTGIVTRAMAFTAGYPKSVLAPSAPRG